MNIIKCSSGHFYDCDRYVSCPHCVELVLYRGEDKRKLRYKGNDIYVGRNSQECKMFINDDYLGRRHAHFVYCDNAWYLVNLSPKNGTYVNGKRLADNEKVKLQYNDEIKFTKHLTFIFGTATDEGDYPRSKSDGFDGGMCIYASPDIMCGRK